MPEYEKTLILYTFHKKTKYVEYFIKYAIFKHPNIDFLLIVNSKKLNSKFFLKVFVQFLGIR